MHGAIVIVIISGYQRQICPLLIAPRLKSHVSQTLVVMRIHVTKNFLLYVSALRIIHQQQGQQL